MLNLFLSAVLISARKAMDPNTIVLATFLLTLTTK